MKVFVYLILTALPLFSKCQNSFNKEVDSLKNLLKEAKSSEDSLITKYEIGKSLIGKDTIGLTYLYEALSIAEADTLYGKHLSNIYWAIGAHYTNYDSKYTNQLNAQRKAVYYAEKYLSEEKYASALVSLATILSVQHPDSSILYIKQAIKFYESVGIESAALYENLAALNFFIEGDPEITLGYYKEAELVSYRTNDTIALAQLYYNLSLAYYMVDQFDPAFKYLDMALNYSQEKPNLPIKIDSSAYLRRKGNIFFRKGDFENSTKFHIQVLPRLSNEEQIASTQRMLGVAYGKLNDYTKALKYFTEALIYSKKANLSDIEQRLNNDLYQLHLEMEDYKSAVNYLKRSIAIKDSLNSVESNNKSYQVELAQSSEKLKQLEVKLLKEQTESQQTILSYQKKLITGTIISLVVLSFFLFITVLSQRKIRSQNYSLKEANNTILSQASKLKELSQAKSLFFTNVSHDLRSPLTLIQGALSKIIEKDYEVLDRESRSLLEVGYKNGKRLLYLAEEIMELTKLEEGITKSKFEIVRLKPYLEFLIEMFSSAADLKHIRILFNSEKGLNPILKVDPSQFEKIVYNLLSNAIKFTPNGGTIKINLSVTKDLIQISISDNGPGIPSEKIDYIFDRFYQTQSNAYHPEAGIGIGLAIVKELIELHGARIKVRSSSEGTTFDMLFKPCSENTAKAIVPDESLDIVTRNSLWLDLQEDSKTIQVASLLNPDEDAKAVLIVEDHKELRTYLTNILSKEFRIYQAENGEKALQVLKNEKIDLIISDLMMPIIDGFKLIDELKAQKDLKNIPILILSARTNQKEKIELIKNGVDGVIYKPFNNDELIVRCKSLLSRRIASSNPLEDLYVSKADEFEKNIISKLERLVIKNIDNPSLSVIHLADEMAASESKVNRMIKRLTGTTPYEFIREIRWRYLEEYLDNHKVKSISKAAQLIGMKNSTYFGEQYKKKFGISIEEKLAEKT